MKFKNSHICKESIKQNEKMKCEIKIKLPDMCRKTILKAEE